MPGGFTSYKYEALNDSADNVADRQDAEEFEMQTGSSLTALRLHEIDGIHDGLVAPTEEERLTLRRIPDTVPCNVYLITLVELAERFSFYGSSVVFTNFIQYPLPAGSLTGAGLRNGQSGALGKGQQASTGITMFYQFWCSLSPLLGAYIADVYLGRFQTICVAVVIVLIGHILLIFSAIPGVIEHPDSAMGIFVVALVIMGLGTGLFQANISPLVAEQYRRTKLFVITTDSGEQVIVDPVLTTSRIYMYFYLMANVGTLVGQITMTYSEKYVGFWLAYTLPTVVFLMCPIVLFAARKRYIRYPPTGSVLVIFFRLIRFASHGRWSLNPFRTWRNLTANDFWDSAKPSHIEPEERPRWMRFDDQWVDEVRRGLKACAVFCWYPLYWLTLNQISNNLTSQAATLSTHGLPNDVLSNMDPLALIIFIPLCDIYLYPALQRWRFNFSSLQKVTAGFLTASAAMLWAAVVQYNVYSTNPCHYSAATCKDAQQNPLVSPISVWIQTPVYVLIAFSEILTAITGFEYAFTKAPKNMRSLVMSVFMCTSAISSVLGEAFLWLSVDPMLVWNYSVMAGLAAVAGMTFWITSGRALDVEEDRLNSLSAGHVAKDVDS